MDIKQSLGYRSDNYKQYNINGIQPYDYEQFGILSKTLPKVLFKGNSLFVTFLQLIDMRIILLIKYVDKLKRFKHVTWYE